MRKPLSTLLVGSLLFACGGGGGYQGDPNTANDAQNGCQGGAVPAGDQCVCPESSQWDGAQCVQAGGGQQQVYEQRTYQGSQSFTCCVNHAKYTCPDQASFQACSTLSAHNCAPAGGC